MHHNKKYSFKRCKWLNYSSTIIRNGNHNSNGNTIWCIICKCKMYATHTISIDLRNLKVYFRNDIWLRPSSIILRKNIVSFKLHFAGTNATINLSSWYIHIEPIRLMVVRNHRTSFSMFVALQNYCDVDFSHVGRNTLNNTYVLRNE